MSDVKKQLVEALLELNELYPQWRFGQLLENVAAWSGEEEPGNAWDVSDEDLLTAARRHLAQKHVSA